MAGRRKYSSSSSKRGILARPLDALVFLLPLILFYELAAATRNEEIIASVLLRQFLQLFGEVGMWATGLAVMAILLATHIASGEPWVIHIREVGFMYLEAVGMALPLLLLNRVMPLMAANGATERIVNRIALGIGAGVYEELVFRLILISIVAFIGIDLLKFRTKPVAIAAILLSALCFALYHHVPIGTERFTLDRFVFRSLAGLYLGVIFWYRGYGPAAGCHAAYNVALVAIASLSQHES